MGNHKYAELVDRLRQEILDGKYTGGQKLPSENQLAQETGYSRQTIRHAISILENEGIIVRRQGSGTYVEQRAPRREPSRNIAVVTTYIDEYIFPVILQGIDAVLSEHGYTPLLMATKNRVDNERRVLMELMSKPIDGLIVEGTKTALPNPNIDLYHHFASQGIPTVFINGYYPNLRQPIYVVADDWAGGEMACRLLLEKGHQKIAGIFKSDDMQGHRRYAGFAEALRSAGRVVEDDRVLWYTTENQREILDACALSTLQGCTAVVCYNDEVALYLIQLLTRAGIADTVKVVSFDHSRFARISAVPFLSLSSSQDRLGRLAAEKMLRILQGYREEPTVLPWDVAP